MFYHARPLIQQELFVCGYIGVEFFFLVSGYLLMKKAREASFLPGETGAEPGGSGDIFEENLKMLCHKLRGILPYLIPALICAFLFRYAFSDRSLTEALHDLAYAVVEAASLQMFGFENGALVDAAWYLSSLLIVSFVLYPILRRWPKAFILYAGPLLVLLIYGYFSRTLNGAMNMPTHWYGLCFKGLLRGFAGMTLGCVSYEAAERLRKVFPGADGKSGLPQENQAQQESGVSQEKRTQQESGGLLGEIRRKRAAFTAMELGGYGIAIAYLIFCPVQTSLDFLITALLFFFVTISFSGVSGAAGLFDRESFRFLGVFSLSVFLNHSYIRENMRRLFGGLIGNDGGLLALYAVLVLAVSLGNFFLGRYFLFHRIRMSKGAFKSLFWKNAQK